MILAAYLAAILLTCLAAACAVYWGVVLQRIIAARKLPTLRSGLQSSAAPAAGGEPATVCVIVPAHNEAEVIVDVVNSILAQDYRSFHVIVALDRCSDDTETLVRRFVKDDDRVTIFNNDHCPEGWAGKVHVLHRAVQETAAARQADLLLFADADTRFAPACLRAAVNLQKVYNLDLLSVLPTLTAATWWERMVQPATSFELIRQFPLDRVNSPNHRRAFASGQFMLFTRAGYQAIGGHAAVHDELLEDIAMARRCRQLQRPFAVVLADRLLHCRMYRDWPAFRRGWKRIYTEACTRRPDRLVRWSRRLRLTGVLLPWCAALALVSAPFAIVSLNPWLGWVLIAAGLAGLLFFILALLRIYQRQESSGWWCLTYPIGAQLAASIMAEAKRDLQTGIPTRWGGKSYHRTAVAGAARPKSSYATRQTQAPSPPDVGSESRPTAESGAPLP